MSIEGIIVKLKEKNIRLRLDNGQLKLDAPQGVLNPELIEEIKEYKEELIQFLNGRNQTKDYVKIPKAKEQEFYPLSSTQKSLYFFWQLDKTSVEYNMPQVFELKGKPDISKIELTFKKLIKRHEVLRTRFVLDGIEPVQKVEKEVEFSITYEEIAEKEIEQEIKKLIKPFDLDVAPLLRVNLLKINDTRFILMIDMHHIISDESSNGIIIKEFLELYKGEELPGLEIHFKDYIVWQNSDSQQDKLKLQEDFWLNKMDGEIPVLDLACDYSRPLVKSYEGNFVEFCLDEKVHIQLKQISKESGASLFMVLLSVFNLLLHKLTNQQDIIIGTPIAGRKHPDLSSMLGMFVNTLPLRNRLEVDWEFSEFLEKVKNDTIEAFDSQEYSFGELVGKLNLDRDMGRNPMFDVLFALYNTDIGTATIPGLELSPYKSNTVTSKFDLTLHGVEEEGKISLFFEYSTKLFKKETIERYIGYFREIVKQVIKDPNQKISKIDILSDNEKQLLLNKFNDTISDYPKGKSINELFKEQAAKTPEDIAVYCVNEKITFKELDDRSDKLSAYLLSKNYTNQVIGILAERNIKLIIGILGILKSGNSYLPMDIKHPDDRNTRILKESGTQLILSNIPGLDINDVQIIDLNNEDIYNQKYQYEQPKVKSSDLAYVIYTSGSTGVPKGVMVEHGNIINFVYGMKENIPTNSGSLLSLTTISFDIFGLELYVPLLSGMPMVLSENQDQYQMKTLLSIIDKTNVTILQLTPSRLKLMLSDDLSKDIFSRIKILLVGGEEFPASLHKKVLEETDCEIYNMYGPTETTIWSTCKNVSRGNILNIGKPIINTQIYILGSKLELLAIGVPGELYIAGDGISRGYYKNDQLTEERFIDNPYNEGTKLYKTGDLARWLPNGEIEFLGRLDYQVKIRGFRIELGEIESVLLEHENVNECVVISRQDKEDKYLCAYLTVKGEDDQRHREFLLERLPDYMIPSYFVVLESFPLTPNGKIDRKALPEPEIKAGDNYEAPENETEEKLVEIWSDILKIPAKEISVTSNFFELGGHSLNATSILAAIYKEFGYELLMVEFFKKSTIKEVAKFILASDWINESTVIDDIEKEEILL